MNKRSTLVAWSQFQTTPITPSAPPSNSSLHTNLTLLNSIQCKSLLTWSCSKASTSEKSAWSKRRWESLLNS